MKKPISSEEPLRNAADTYMVEMISGNTT